MDAQEEFGLKVYLTKETVDRALANIELLDRAAKLLDKLESGLAYNPNFAVHDDVEQWRADYERSK